MAAWITEALQNQRAHGVMWTPILLAIGIGGYFSLNFEPDLPSLLLVAALCVTALFLGRYFPYPYGLIPAITGLIALGLLLAAVRAQWVAAPILPQRYFGPVQGRIIQIDRSSSNLPRITLDRVRLPGEVTLTTPLKVRVSLSYPEAFFEMQPGQNVMLMAMLSPPAGPVEPGGFNFQRHAWFLGLGAVGYSRSPLLQFAPRSDQGWTMALLKLRLRLSARIKARMPGQKGAFAAAILTGDRAAIDPAILKDLRAANLAHLLAISGLHMGLLTGIVFATLRYAMALVPFVALRLPTKKIAAVGALIAALTYLGLSGANIATQRAFVMVAVMLLAILLNRRALTLRAVAIAALIILTLRPESLISAGFQMSFAATTALVATFGLLRGTKVFSHQNQRFKRWMRAPLTVLISSAIAGAATAPFSAYHFNQIGQYGLIANLASVPLMGLVVMPAALVALLLTPFGAAAIAFTIMGLGIEWILFVAKNIAALPGAIRYIISPNDWVLPMITLGFLTLILWRGRGRLLGAVPVIAAFILWGQSQRPEVLISANGRVIGVMTANGRAINRNRGNGFIVKNWLASDGDGADQQSAAMRIDAWGKSPDDLFTLGPYQARYTWRKDLDSDFISTYCKENLILITPRYTAESAHCTLLDQKSLAKLGAVALTFQAGGLRITGARNRIGTRYWSP